MEHKRGEIRWCSRNDFDRGRFLCGTRFVLSNQANATHLADTVHAITV